MQPDIHVASDPRELSEGVAQRFSELGRAAIRERAVFRVCVAGGNTPRGAYELLARPAPPAMHSPAWLEWERVHIYFGDERCVAPEDSQSNFRMLRESLLEHVPIAAHHVHRIEGELEPARTAERYAAVLKAALGSDAQGWPEQPFDLVMLGLGADAHTASLFPGSSTAPRDWVSARQQPQTGQWRVTLTEPVINAAREVMLLVAGAEKAAALFEVVRGPRDLARLPGQRIAPRGLLSLWTDSAAAKQLGNGPA